MILRIIIINMIGSMFHFTYELSNHNKIVSIFSAVNESVWEHIKIALSASFFITIIDMFSGKIYSENYLIAKFISLLSIIILIPTIFYGYQIFTKKSILLFDISLFVITIIISEVFFNKLLSCSIDPFYNYVSIIGLLVILVMYLSFTKHPPKNFLFKDSITNKYGYEAHSH